jgi:hypothetical protein
MNKALLDDLERRLRAVRRQLQHLRALLLQQSAFRDPRSRAHAERIRAQIQRAEADARLLAAEIEKARP